ncbi:MAG: hypothetical protein KA751_12770 [Comamonas sp.]|nr:hypothetical protein [Comamonas sp.]
MAVDMKWRDAMSDRRIRQYFSDEEQAQGWPQRMDAQQLAALQRPNAHGDAAGRKAQGVLCDALLDDCEAGTLACEEEVLSVPVPVAGCNEDLFRPISLTGGNGNDYSNDYSSGYSPYTPAQPVQMQECTFYLVAAADFARWLQGQDMQSSTHVAAWFKACGVVLASATALQGQAMLTPPDVQDLATLVLYRQQFAQQPEQERPQWHAEHVALLAAWLQRQHSEGRKRGALTELAQQLGMRRQTLAELLQRHGFKSSGEADGVQQVAVVDLRSAVNGWGGRRNG